MPLQPSGAISLADIAAEFGGSAPHSLSEYYRGGGLVPDTPANAGIPHEDDRPTPISLSDFYGGDATEATVTVSGATIAAFSIFPDGAAASLSIDDDGNTYRALNGGSAQQINGSTDWIRPASEAPGSYQVRFTSFSGNALTSSTKPAGTWHALSSGAFILLLSRSSIGVSECTFTIQIREGTGSVIASAEYTLRTTVES